MKEIIIIPHIGIGQLKLGMAPDELENALLQMKKQWSNSSDEAMQMERCVQMYSGTAGETNFYGTSKLSGEVRKSDKYHFDYAAVEQKGVDADGKPIYVPYTGGVKGSDAEEYFKSVRGIDEAYVYDNSFLKLRELSLSYPVYKKDNLNVNVNVFARNIIVWSEIKGFDPEATQGNNNMAGAFERFSLPGTSSYGFGVNVNF